MFKKYVSAQVKQRSAEEGSGTLLWTFCSKGFVLITEIVLFYCALCFFSEENCYQI